MAINIGSVAKRIACSPEEGMFSAPVATITGALHKLLAAKHAIDISYRSYADRVRGPWRDSLVGHWSEHAGEERQMAYDIAMKLMALDYDPIISTIEVPPCGPTLASLAKCLVEQEKTAIMVGRQIIAACGDNTSLRVMMEDHVMKDQQHLDDLRRMFNQIGAAP